jgi:cytoskeleton protein RodZ
MKEPEFPNFQKPYSSADNVGLAEGVAQGQNDVSIGTFLRQAREKKGLSHVQISEMIRLKPLIIQAMEDEDWEKLPSPVLASGFVRSYGRVLGLKEEHIKMLFQESRPAYTPRFEPLVTPAKSRRPALIILVISFLLLVPAYFFWKGDIIRLKTPSAPVTTESAEGDPVQPQNIQEAPVSNELAAPIEQRPSELEPTLDETTTESNETVPISDSTEPEIPVSQDETSTAMRSAPDQTGQSDIMNFSLSVMFHDTTWIRIFVDDLEPREYIFQPEERYQWRAKNGFELLIGNAGATEVMLNGQKVDLPDTPGKVVRLNLPEGYKKENNQN